MDDAVYVVGNDDIAIGVHLHAAAAARAKDAIDSEAAVSESSVDTTPVASPGHCVPAVAAMGASPPMVVMV